MFGNKGNVCQLWYIKVEITFVGLKSKTSYTNWNDAKEKHNYDFSLLPEQKGINVAYHSLRYSQVQNNNFA